MAGDPVHGKGQWVTFILSALSVHCLQRRFKLAYLRLINGGIADAGPVNADVAVAANDAVNGRQGGGLIGIEGRIPVVGIFIHMIDNHFLASLIDRVTPVINAATAIQCQIAVSRDHAGIVE